MWVEGEKSDVENNPLFLKVVDAIDALFHDHQYGRVARSTATIVGAGYHNKQEATQEGGKEAAAGCAARGIV